MTVRDVSDQRQIRDDPVDALRIEEMFLRFIEESLRSWLTSLCILFFNQDKSNVDMFLNIYSKGVLTKKKRN